MKFTLLLLIQCLVFQAFAQRRPRSKSERYFDYYDAYTRAVPNNEDLSTAEKKVLIKEYKDSARRLEKDILAKGPIWEQSNFRFFHHYANELTGNMRYKKARKIYHQLYALEDKHNVLIYNSYGWHLFNGMYNGDALKELADLYSTRKRWFGHAMYKWFKIRIRKQKYYVRCALGCAELQSRTDHKRINLLKRKEGARMALDYTCHVGVYINSSILEPYQMEDIYYELLREYHTAAEIKEELDRSIADAIQKRIEEKAVNYDLDDCALDIIIPIFDTYIHLSKPYEVCQEKGSWENPIVREALLNKLYNSNFYYWLRVDTL